MQYQGWYVKLKVTSCLILSLTFTHTLLNSQESFENEGEKLVVHTMEDLKAPSMDHGKICDKHHVIINVGARLPTRRLNLREDGCTTAVPMGQSASSNSSNGSAGGLSVTVNNAASYGDSLELRAIGPRYV
jgi:hypothetical protein